MIQRQTASAIVGRWLDEAFSGRWWWRVRRHLAEKRLERTLEAGGDKSVAARRATERYREMQFAVAYLRAASAPVRQVVRNARKAGVGAEDLQLIVLNTDLRASDAGVSLRRSVLARALSAGMATVVAAQWVLICAVVALAPAPYWQKAVLLVLMLSVYAALYRGWTLYAYRPLEAVTRYGDAIDRACASSTPGSVRDLRASEVTPDSTL